MQRNRQSGGYALPYSYPPQLPVWEAILRVVAATVRILVGSAVFAVCGGWAWHAWETVPNLWLRIPLLAALLVLFLISFGSVMLGVHLAVNAAVRRTRKA